MHFLADLASGRYFVKLDLSQAYLQLQVNYAATRAQAIVTHRDMFLVKRLQFGVATAPSIFQWFIKFLLVGVEGMCPYFDDVLIFAPAMDQLLLRIRSVLQRFQDVGI